MKLLQIFIGLFFLLSSSCSNEGKIRDYISKCNERNGPLWSTYSNEQYELLIQYMPPLLCALNELKSSEVETSKLDSLAANYENYISFKIYFSDYFNFKSESVLDDVSISAELNLENYLREHLILVAQEDSLKYPAVHVLKSNMENKPLVGLIYFDVTNYANRKEKIALCLKQLGVENLKNRIFTLDVKSIKHLEQL